MIFNNYVRVKIFELFSWINIIHCLFIFSVSPEDHCHRERNEEIDKKARKKLLIASVLCVIFMIAEIVGNIKQNSWWPYQSTKKYFVEFIYEGRRLIVSFIRELLSSGGVLSNSLAIATDAAHLLTDFASFMISLFSIWVAGRPATRKMPFGWYRAEVSSTYIIYNLK